MKLNGSRRIILPELMSHVLGEAIVDPVLPTPTRDALNDFFMRIVSLPEQSKTNSVHQQQERWRTSARAAHTIVIPLRSPLIQTRAATHANGGIGNGSPLMKTDQTNHHDAVCDRPS